MNYSIVHEADNRIRISTGVCKYKINEADVLAYYLETFRFLKFVKVHERTGNIIIGFLNRKERIDKRQVIFDALKKYNYEEEKGKVILPEKSTRIINAVYQEKILYNVTFNIVKNVFFPSVISQIHTVYKALRFIIRGVKYLLQGKLVVEVLDAISIGVSIARRDFSTAGSVMFMLSIASMLEDWTHKRSVADLARRMSLNIEKVWIKSGEEEILIPINEVKEGDTAVARQGNIIPLDGVVIYGESVVNQASLTGESVGVVKKPGSVVYAGSVVEEGSCFFKVRAINGMSKYDKIIKMIEESEKMKSETESKALRLADRLVPYSLGATLLTYIFTADLYKALSVLMVDFSCALKLAIPICVISAMREAAERNISIKGGKYLEIIANADTVVFDKTGTLTKALPKVVDIITFEDRDKEEMLRIAACLEEHFPHSMAHAVVDEAKKRGLKHEEMHSEVEYVVAHGIVSYIDNERVAIGSAHFIFEDEKIELNSVEKKIYGDLNIAYSHLFMSIGNRLAAIICIFDPIREEASIVIDKLKCLGIKDVVMMTGDNRHTAEELARIAHIDKFYAQVLPEDKANYINKQKNEGRIVIMVGDGINDSPALSAADCGIAISDGAAIAREVADITIAADNLNELVVLRELAMLLSGRVERNYRFVLGFNSLLILMGITGIIRPSFSALLHNASTLGTALHGFTPLIKDYIKSRH